MHYKKLLKVFYSVILTIHIIIYQCFLIVSSPKSISLPVPYLESRHYYCMLFQILIFRGNKFNITFTHQISHSPLFPKWFSQKSAAEHTTQRIFLNLNQLEVSWQQACTTFKQPYTRSSFPIIASGQDIIHRVSHYDQPETLASVMMN